MNDKEQLGRSVVYLEVSKLCELLAAAFETAGKGLDLLVDNLVSADIAPLREPLAASFAGVWSFARVAALVRLDFVRSLAVK